MIRLRIWDFGLRIFLMGILPNNGVAGYSLFVIRYLKSLAGMIASL
jgi:hypothetical protein